MANCERYCAIHSNKYSLDLPLRTLTEKSFARLKNARYVFLFIIFSDRNILIDIVLKSFVLKYTDVIWLFLKKIKLNMR